MPRVFISYRREDAPGSAGRLFDRLRSDLGADNVFFDVDGLRPGVDFVESIHQRLVLCDVLLAVIGPRWASVTGPGGKPRLDDRNDYLRLELETALQRQLRVIPVLVDRAVLPDIARVPEPIRPLFKHQAIELSESRWSYDAERLIQAIRYHSGHPATVLRFADLSKPFWSASLMVTAAALVMATIALVMNYTSQRDTPSTPTVEVQRSSETGSRSTDTPAKDPSQSKPSASATDVPRLAVSGPPALLDSRPKDSAPPNIAPTNLAKLCAESDAESCKERCQTGDAGACATLGWLYQSGTTVQKNVQEAANYYERACNAADGGGCRLLARVLQEGIAPLPKDVLRAVALYEKACGRGDQLGCSNLGYIYQHGDDKVQVNMPKSAHFYQRGCDGGDATGCTGIGWMYSTGEGNLRRDAIQAVKFYELGCHRGDAIGCSNAGWIYETGRELLPPDRARAIELYKRGCERGDTHSCNSVKRLRDG